MEGAIMDPNDMPKEPRAIPPDVENSVGAAHDERVDKAAARAARRVKKGQTWLDWLAIGESISGGRNKAMRRSGANEPKGSAYNRAFADWMDTKAIAVDDDGNPELDDKGKPVSWARGMNEATRTHAAWCFENRDEVERFRLTLGDKADQKNHPTTMRRAWDAKQKALKKAHEAPGDKKETPTEKLNAELAKLDEENNQLKKKLAKAEQDADGGSITELLSGPVKMAVDVIAQSVSMNRLNELAKALTEEAKRRRSIKNGGAK